MKRGFALKSIPTTSLVIWLSLFLAQSARSEDWPHWRGPDRNGISQEKGWKLQGKQLWKQNVGLGYSTVSVIGDLLYTQGYDDNKGIDTVYCLNSKTGEEIWSFSFPAKIWDRAHGGGSLATPTYSDARVYAANREGRFLCFEAKTGKVIWNKDLYQEYGLTYPTWGFAAAPLILGNMVIMNLGLVIAFDKKSGQEIWKTSANYGDAYATPAPFEHQSKACLAVFNKRGLVVLEQNTGKELYSHEWKTKYNVNAATPVVIGNKIFISSGYNKGCSMVELTGSKVNVLWENKSMRNHMAGCVLYENHLYGFDDGSFKCLRLDGEVAWQERGTGKGAHIVADGKIILLTDDGELVIAEADPRRFKELSRTKVLDGGKDWTTPVLANGLIYCRNSRGDLVCRDHRN